MSLRCVIIFLCIVINMTACQYLEYTELRNVTFDTIERDNTRQRRVAGGFDAYLGQFPFVAVIHQLVGKTVHEENIGNCAGTIISKRWVLTAAHCLQLVGWSRGFLVVFGIVDKSSINYGVSWGNPGVSMITTKAFTNSEFDNTTFDNDIGLLLMPEDIPFSESVQPIILFNYDENFANERVYVASWGADHNYAFSSKRLKYTGLLIIENNECQRYYNGFRKINDKQICTASSMYTGRGSCRGDSGGPLIVVRNYELYQIGIVSFGDNSTCPGYFPGVYTKVSVFINWINDVITSVEYMQMLY